MKKILSALISAAMVLASASPAFAADSAELNISADKIGHEVSPTLYGAFIEDISKAGDGGLVQIWFTTTALNTTTPPKKTPRSMRLIGNFQTLPTPLQATGQ